MHLEENVKICPFCKVYMIRTPTDRNGLIEYKPLFTFSCDSFREPSENHVCKYCRSYNDYECPNCHIILMYRE